MEIISRVTIASVDLANQRCLDIKLEVLEQQRGHMHNAVDDYVNTVVTAAKLWTDNKGGRPQYYKLLQTIDSAVELLEMKGGEISERGRCQLQSGAENDGPMQDSVSRISEQLSAQETDDRIPSDIFQLIKTQEKRIEEHEEQMKKMTRKIDKVQKYKILCQMLANRLQRLERLRQIFNKRSKARDKNVTKLMKVMEEGAAMSPKIADLELKSSRGCVGFSAVASDVQNVKENYIIKDFSGVDCNVGCHLNPKSGEFIVPFDGIYCVNITTVCLDKDAFLNVSVHVLYKCSAFGAVLNQQVFWDTSGKNMSHSCDFGILELKAEDVLYAEVVDQGIDISTEKTVRFSCFLIG